MDKLSWVYILASQRNGTLYIGVTLDLIKRVWQHKQGGLQGFTCRYQVNKLVYYEQHHSIHEAIQREKHLKQWRRKWKLRLIEQSNPNWVDLYSSLLP